MPVTIKGSGQTIVQIVKASNSTSFSNSTNSVPTDIVTASITPTSASNTILAIAQVPNRVTDSNSTGNHEAVGQSILYRNSTVIDVAQYLTYVGSESRQQWLDTKGGHYIIDAPATTSSVTYKVAICTNNTAYIMYVPQGSFGGVLGVTSLILMEISGS